MKLFKRTLVAFFLLSTGIFPTILKADAEKLLLAASKNGEVKGIIEALEAGANINTRGSMPPLTLGEPLLNAVKGKHIEAVRTLLDRNAHPDAEDMRAYALHYAVYGGEIEIVQLLLAHGASLDAIAARGPDFPTEKPLQLAERLGRVTIRRLLMSERHERASWESRGWCRRQRAGGVRQEVRDYMRKGETQPDPLADIVGSFLSGGEAESKKPSSWCVIL